MSEISHKASEMRTASIQEASELLRSIAGERKAHESIKGVLRRVQRKLTGWNASRVRAVWYGDPRTRIRSEEIDQLRELASATPSTAAHHELQELRDRIEKLESILAAAGETPYRSLRDPVDRARGEVGATPRPVD